MHKNIRALFIILLLLVIASSSTLLLSHHPVYAKQDNRPNAYFKKLTYRRYNNDGSLHIGFSTPLLYHFNLNNSSHSTTPKILLFDANKVPWHIQANSAHSWHGQQTILLQNKVIFYHPRSGSNPETTIKTSRAYLFPKDNYATSTRKVTMQRPGSKLIGSGLRANLRDGVVTVIKQTHGSFHPHK